MKIIFRFVSPVLLLLASSASAQELIILADKIHTAGPDGILEHGVIIVENGKISHVGVQQDMQVAAGAEIRRAKVVIPGLIDARTTLGLSGAFNVRADQDHDELTGTNQAQLRALDSYNPREVLINYVRGYGVTAVHTSPGDSNLIAGQGAVFKTSGDTIQQAVLKPVASMVFNLGERPKETYAEKEQAPATRMASAAVIRQALHDASHYAEHGGEDGKTDLGLAALAQVVEGELPALFTVHREDDIATAIRIGEEFGLNVWLQYATEGYLMRDTIEASGAKVIVGPTLQRLDALQTFNASLENAALLHEAGIPLTFSSGHEDYVPKERVLLFEMAIAVANGFPADDAIRAATINAAMLLGVEDRIGSIQRGKDADLVLFDGDPFEYTSHVMAVLIDGKVIHSQ